MESYLKSHMKEFVASDKLLEFIHKYDKIIDGSYDSHDNYKILMERFGESITSCSSRFSNNMSVGEDIVVHLLADITPSELAESIKRSVPSHFQTKKLKSFLFLSEELNEASVSDKALESKVRAFGKARHYLLGGEEGPASDLSADAAWVRWNHDKPGFNPLPLDKYPDYKAISDSYDQLKSDRSHDIDDCRPM